MTPVSVPELVDVEADGLEALSALALRSKGHWDYSPDLLEQMRAELTWSADDLERLAMRGIREGAAWLGFYAVEDLEPGRAELDALFVEPAHIGAGIGRQLFEDAITRARERGIELLIIQADPHAEAFYRARGAVTVGHRPSGSVPGRDLPLMELTL